MSGRYGRAGLPKGAMRLELEARAVSPLIEQELDLIGIKDKATILDAGCGTGAVSRKIAKRAPKGK